MDNLMMNNLLGNETKSLGLIPMVVEQTARGDQVTALSLQTAEMMSDLLRLYRRHGFLLTRKALPTHGRDNHLRVHMLKRL